MQLEDLKVFCDLASLRNFSRAAAANGLTQPAVSKIVHALEKRLRGQLIDRSHRPLQLTPLGQAYYEGCKRLLEQYLELEASLLRSPPPLALTVRVAAIYSVGLGDIHQLVELFEGAHGHIRIHIDYLHPDQVYERVREGSADLGLVSFPRPARDLTVLPWREEPMVVACSPQHPLARLPAVPLGRLDGEKFVAFDKELPIRREVDRFLTEHGVEVEVVFEVDSIEHVKKCLELGTGLALLPEPTLRAEVRAGTLLTLPLEGGAIARPLGIIHLRRPAPGAAAQDFIALLRGADHKACDGPPLTNGVPAASPAEDADSPGSGQAADVPRRTNRQRRKRMAQ